MDEQYDMFGGSTMVARELSRPVPAPERGAQMALFASDAGELDGQTAATDVLGALAEESR